MIFEGEERINKSDKEGGTSYLWGFPSVCSNYCEQEYQLLRRIEGVS